MNDQWMPAYLHLLQAGELKQRVERAYQALEGCSLCGWDCRKNRRAGQVGVCRTSDIARVSGYGAHMGEEAPLTGWRGSGTIFFARCNLVCQYCQNWDISQVDSGKEVQPDELAEMMLELQEGGVHNINLVSPTHVVPQFLAALLLAAQAGLRLPIVYNTGGYDSIEVLALLDGVVDIYMPDMKYSSPQAGLHYSKVRHYPQVNQAAVREMHRQVGDLQVDEQGLARRGLLVRHLVLPQDVSGTEKIVQFLAQEISKNTYVNIMDQYHPAYHANQFPKLKRPVTPHEYAQARMWANAAGLHRFDN